MVLHPRIISHARLCSGGFRANRVGVVRLLSPTPLMPSLGRKRLRRRFLPTIIRAQSNAQRIIRMCSSVLREISTEFSRERDLRKVSADARLYPQVVPVYLLKSSNKNCNFYMCSTDISHFSMIAFFKNV